MSRDSIVAVDFLGVDYVSAETDENASGKAVDQQKNERAAVNSLSWIKPHMMERVLSFKGFSEQRKAESTPKRQTEALGGSEGLNQKELMGLFPQQAGFGSNPATKRNILTPASVLQTLQWPSLGHCLAQGVAPANTATSWSANSVSAQGNAQLTIFYNGTVNVYDVSPDKAQAIMTLAGDGNSHHQNESGFRQIAPRTPTSAASTGRSISTFPATNAAVVQLPAPRPSKPLPGVIHQTQTSHTLHADLPIARKHSLQRFLEKRKDRLTSVAPYITTAAVPKTSVNNDMYSVSAASLVINGV